MDLIHRIYRQRTWDKGYYRHCKVSLIPWPTLRGRWWRKTIDQTLRHTWWLFIQKNIVNYPFICGNIPTAPLRMEFSYHMPYVILQLVVTTQNFCNPLDFLCYKKIKVITREVNYIINPWVVTVYPSAPWKNWFVQRAVIFLPSFFYRRIDFLWETRRGFLEKPVFVPVLHSFDFRWNLGSLCYS